MWKSLENYSKELDNVINYLYYIYIILYICGRHTDPNSYSWEGLANVSQCDENL